MYFLNVGGLVTQKFKLQKFIMQKIRIKQTPKAGDQRDFSLVHRQAHYISEGVPSDTPVKNTMGAVPREEANIEVEGGETVVGDVNNDGFLEHMTFVGKRHSEGGVPVNIPEGSFIFSDTKKLKIKDKEALKEVFGLPFKKGGYTPAEIAKRYQVNSFIDDLKNPETDEISKRSATKMLQNNMEKLGMLALMQESMKGFPDGVPAIAESVMAGLQGQGEPQGEMPQGKMGGLYKAQQGKNVVKSTGNKKLDSLIADYKANPSKEKAEILKEAIEKSYPEGGADMFFSPGHYAANAIDNSVAKDAYFEARRFGQKPYDGRNDIQKDRDVAKSLKPQALQVVQKMKSELAANKENLLPFEIRKMESDIKNLESNIAQGKGSQIRFYLEKANPTTTSQKQESGDVSTTKSASLTFKPKSTSTNTSASPAGSTPFVYTPDVEKKMKEQASADDGEFKKILDKPFEEFVGKKPVTPAPSSGTKSKPAAKPIKAGDTHASIDDFFNSYRSGGYVYQDAGTVKEEPKTEVKPEAAPKSDSKPYAQGVVDGKKVFIYYEGDDKILKDEQGNVLKSTKASSKFVPHQGDRNPSKNPVTGKVEQGWNKSKYTPEEIDKLARARGYNGPRDNVKLQQWLMARPEYSKVVKELHTKYGQPKAGKEDDGFWGVRWDDALMAIPEESKPEAPVTTTPATEPAKTEAKKEETVATQAAVPAPKKKSGSWWLQDIVNFTGTLTDQVNRYEPTQGKIDLQTPGYATLDPTRRLAANQEQFARLQNMTENTTDGNVGLAAMTGAQGQAFANAANAISEVENANVGIVNQAYAQNANIMNQEAGANEAGRQKYVEDMATLNQQYDNALQQKKWREIAAFNNGTSNWFRKKQMEQVLFPDIYVDPLSGDVDVDPSARDPLGYQTYAPAYSDGRKGTAGLGTSGVDAWSAAYNEALPTMGDADARKYANNIVASQMRNANNTATSPSSRQRYSQAIQQGLMLPPNEFGGTVDYPWIDLD